MQRFLYLLLLFSLSASTKAQSWHSQILYPNPAGQLVYVADSLGNHVPNWGHVGYRGGAPLPVVPNVDTLYPVPGDNRPQIQAAIDAMSVLPLNAQGHRGALLLMAGAYEISGTIDLHLNGVVLRGVGQDSLPGSNTILRSTDTTQVDVIVAGAGNRWDRWRDSVPGTKSNILNECLPMGTYWLELADASPYFVGAPVVVYHPSTHAWLATVNFGDPDTDGPWQPGDIDIQYRRRVAAVSGNYIRLDAPLYHPMRRDLSQAYVYLHDSTAVKREIGVENLRIVCDYNGATDESHAANMLAFFEAENCWARNVTAQNFVRSGFIASTASRITVEACAALDPISVITGSRRYNFSVETATSDILFRRCRATDGRHSYVSNGTAKSAGIVFTQSVSVGDYTSAEGHRWWSHALLYDSLLFLSPNTTSSNPVFDRVLGLYNRGSYGTSHGWASAHSAIWNNTCEDANFVVEQPPTAQNYAFGCRISNGTVLGSGPFGQPAGWIEGNGLTPAIGSLYRAQKAQLDQYGWPPDPAACLQVRDTTYGLLLDWIDNDQAEAGYIVERSADGIVYLPIDTLPANATGYADTLFSSGTYYYRVQTFNAATIAPYSNWVTDTFTYVVGQVEATLSKPELPFPNPADEVLSLRLPEAPLTEPARAVLCDLHGRVLSAQWVSDGFLSFSTVALPAGIYALTIAQAGERRTFKVEIRH